MCHPGSVKSCSWNRSARWNFSEPIVNHCAAVRHRSPRRVRENETMTFAKTRVRSTCMCLVPALLLFAAGCSEKGPKWAARNQQVIEQSKITGRTRELPAVSVPAVLEPGVPVEGAKMPTATIAPGVTAALGWGRGALLERLDMQPGAAYPEQTLGEELIIIGREGSATVQFSGKTAELGKDQVLFLQPGTRRTVKAGQTGWKAFEVYSPLRLDHLALVRQSTTGANPGFADQGATPSLQPGVVVNLSDIQWTPITNPDTAKSYKRSPGQARLIWGRNAQVSLVRMDPGSVFPLHIHPEDQLTHTIRGTLEQGVMERTFPSSGSANNIVFLPGGMVHSAHLGDVGADQVDVFWPVRPDYVERANKQRALYEQIIAPGVAPRKLADGFSFTEGPTWLKGTLYFSDMFFQNPSAGDWTGSPARSRLIAMTPDGKSRVLAKGMQTNGTIAAANGHLLVCDMFGHRVIEVDPTTGRVVRVVLDKVDGKRIDGPNDLVMDAKGGLYITDPQFTPEAEKSQPGKQVYYVAPDGTAKVVVGAGEFAMPNGVELSPDGKTLYVDNTWLQPGENFVWAYDVAADGSLSNKRQFAMLSLTPDVLGAAKPVDRFNSGADGTAVDMDGRLYLATRSGVQIFMPDGTQAGTIVLPQYPVSVTFGGPNNDLLYMVGESSVWSIQTKVRGFRHPGGLD
jgi:gluconolactonase